MVIIIGFSLAIVIGCLVLFAAQNWTSGWGWVSIITVSALAIGPFVLAWQFLPTKPLDSGRHTAMRPVALPDIDLTNGDETDEHKIKKLAGQIAEQQAELERVRKENVRRAGDLARAEEDRKFLRSQLEESQTTERLELEAIRQLRSDFESEHEGLRTQIADAVRKMETSTLPSIGSAGLADSTQPCDDGWEPDCDLWEPCSRSYTCCKPVIGADGVTRMVAETTLLTAPTPCYSAPQVTVTFYGPPACW